jgi:hypothetical protein
MRGTSGTLIVEQRTVFAPGFRSWQDVEASYNIKGIVFRDFYGQKHRLKGTILSTYLGGHFIS